MHITVRRVVAQHGKTRIRLVIHPPRAVDLTVDLGHDVAVRERVRRAAHTIGPLDMDLELPWQSRLDAFLFRNLVRLRNDAAIWGTEVLVLVAPIDPRDPIAWTTGDVEEILVVRVAPALLRHLRLRLRFRYAEVVDPANMALLTRHRARIGGVR